MFGADLSASVRVKISTDVQAAGLRSGTKAGQCMLYLLFYKRTVKTCEVKIIQLIFIRTLVALIFHSNITLHYDITLVIWFLLKRWEDLQSALLQEKKKYEWQCSSKFT